MGAQVGGDRRQGSVQFVGGLGAIADGEGRRLAPALDAVCPQANPEIGVALAGAAADGQGVVLADREPFPEQFHPSVSRS